MSAFKWKILKTGHAFYVKSIEFIFFFFFKFFLRKSIFSMLFICIIVSFVFDIIYKEDNLYQWNVYFCFFLHFFKYGSHNNKDNFVLLQIRMKIIRITYKDWTWLRSMVNYVRDHCTYTKSIVILIFSRLHVHDSTFVRTELIIRFLQLSESRTIMLIKVSLD